MPNLFRPCLSFRARPVPVFLLCLLAPAAPRAFGQTALAPPTGIYKQLARIDLSVSAAGFLSTSVSGVEQRDASTTHSALTIKPSSTVGELLTLRYTAKPWVGFELNFSNARFTQDYTFVPPPATNILLGGAQAGAREETLGYVAHPAYHPFGLDPFLGAGGGTIRFTPTPFGGQGLPQQYRAVYYYQAGVDDYFPTTHLGVRLGFRQMIYLAPDFGQNYLTITRRTITTQPTIGFFLRF